MSEAYFLLGSNLGDRAALMRQASHLLAQKVGNIKKQSALYETTAWGNTEQPAFLNQVVMIQTHQHPLDLLRYIRQIEQSLGRVRYEKWGSRLIDVDLLYYGELIMKSAELTVPHPYLHERRFTLVPLAEIAPYVIHPILKQSNEKLLAQCKDSGEVSVFFEK